MSAAARCSTSARTSPTRLWLLFGKPEAVSAEVLREKRWAGANDSFNIRLRYPGLIVTARRQSVCRCLLRRAYHLRGTQGGLLEVRRRPAGGRAQQDHPHRRSAWGQEPSAAWGMLHVDIEGGSVSRPVPALAGDYRLYYAGIRDALLGKAPAPVTGVDGWRVARLLEWAVESSEKRREITCDWSERTEIALFLSNRCARFTAGSALSPSAAPRTGSARRCPERWKLRCLRRARSEWRG